MVNRRLMATGVAIGLLLAAAAPVAAHDGKPPRNAYTETVLVHGPTPDADLVNGWGLARGPGTPWWVADNGTGLSTLYNGAGSKLGLVVTIPADGQPDAAPTGMVFNPGAAAGDFHGDNFLFASEAGVISGWRGALGTTAEVGNGDQAGDAVFKGLAIGTADLGGGAASYLFATDFHHGRIDVFDRTFTLQTWAHAFVDPRLPRGYAPFGIQDLNGMLFVTYAKTQKGSNDELAGIGRGVVDAFATNGRFLARVATHGPLDAPWGLAWAPADFGRFSGDLIVG
ncbi:MAG: TIGR03118 family protein, partial [Candidatus Limnocylindrales bacterium]